MDITYHGYKGHVTDLKEDGTFKGFLVLANGKKYYVRRTFFKWQAKYQGVYFTDTLEQSNKSDSYNNALTAIRRSILHAHSS